MSPYYKSIEDVIADENFLAWYLGTDSSRSNTWQQWLATHEEDQPVVSQAIDFLNTLRAKETEPSEQQVSAALSRLESSLSTTPVVKLHSSRRWWIPAAAAAIVVLCVGLVFLTSSGQKKILATNYGKIGEYKLPDGTEVILNAHSAVTLGEKWKVGTAREIWLKGEAFFKVHKTSTHDKFVVHTSTMDIEVTGTQFNVVNRQNEASVLLTEGSVTIHGKNGKEIHMKPGDFVKIENNELEKKPVNEEKVLAWKQSKLIFDHTSMREVASTISSYYNVKVRFADSTIADKEIGGVMSNDNLDLLLESLKALGEFKITKSEDEIIIARP